MQYISHGDKVGVLLYYTSYYIKIVVKIMSIFNYSMCMRMTTEMEYQ